MDLNQWFAKNHPATLEQLTLRPQGLSTCAKISREDGARDR